MRGLRLKSWRGGVVALVCAAGWLGNATVPSTAGAQDIAVPVEPKARAAFEVLERHCARCHQQGRLLGRERPAKNFGNVLQLDQIAANPNYVLPGNPLGSKLLRQIADKEMPYDVNYEGETRYGGVTGADVKALEDWIAALGDRAAAACERHKTLGPQDVMATMAADIDRQPAARRAGTRYLTLTHLANLCTDPAAMKVYRQGAIKLLNSLSRSPDPVRLETIDADASILRINLNDLGWSAADWDRLVAIYPYAVQPQGQLSAGLAATTRTPLPYLRADWLAFAASQPPVYHDMLRLPPTFQEMARAQGVDVVANIRNFTAQRAGFQKSGVSQNNRLIERHPSRNGYFWTSYDFAGNRDHQSLFDHPLGPGGGDGFRHDGGETIFGLPNGFQAYYLNRAGGERLDKGPTTIVRDVARKDFAVTNGISCMGCHDQGLRKAKDDIRDSVLGNRSLPRSMRETVEGLYPPHDRMDALIESDAKRFAEAMSRAGLDPALKLNGVEMINALFKRYEDDIDLTKAAAELGIDAKSFKEAMADAAPKLKPLLRRLVQGAVPRDQFELGFADIAAELTDLEPVRMASARPAKPLGESPPRPVAPSDLSLTSDADSYRVGDSPQFTIVAPRDCFLTLTDVDERGEGTVLLPNRFQQDNFVRAGAAVRFPGDGAPFHYAMKDKGTETVVAVCSVRPDGGDGIRHDFTRDAFTPVPDYTAALSRSIAVVGTPSDASSSSRADRDGARPSAAGPTAATQPPRASFRAAIRLQVR